MTGMGKNLKAEMSLTGKNGNLLETIAGIGEVVTDVCEVGGESFSSIPVVGTLFQLVRAAETIRDRTLAAKLKRFLEPFAEASQECRDRFQERLMQDEVETRRVGEILFLVVDRLTDLDKAMILGCLFVAFLDNQLTSADLRRMAQAIDISFADDLFELLESEGDLDQSEEIWLKALVSSGLAEPVGAKMFDEMGNIYYSMTELGKKTALRLPQRQEKLLTMSCSRVAASSILQSPPTPYSQAMASVREALENPSVASVRA